MVWNGLQKCIGLGVKMLREEEIEELKKNLKKCPWCKGDVHVWEEKVYCDNEHCWGNVFPMHILMYNHRPIEDELQEKLDIAINALKHYAKSDMHWSVSTEFADEAFEKLGEKINEKKES